MRTQSYPPLPHETSYVKIRIQNKPNSLNVVEILLLTAYKSLAITWGGLLAYNNFKLFSYVIVFLLRVKFSFFSFSLIFIIYITIVN